MTNVKNLISAVAFSVALTPMVGAAAFTYGTAQNTAYLSAPAHAYHLAANSKGRPAEFNTATNNQVAANSKGRPAEFTPASQVAANSKGRPAEFTPASSQVAVNSKGRPAEFAPGNQVAVNSKGRPAEFTPITPRTTPRPTISLPKPIANQPLS